MSAEVALGAPIEFSHLRAAPHQVAGHLFEDNKQGSLVDDKGRFFKPLQVH